MTGEESKNQLLEGLLKDAMKHLNDTLDKALSLEKELNLANERIKEMTSILEIIRRGDEGLYSDQFWERIGNALKENK